MNKGIYFGARNILKPGVYGVINASEMVPNRLGAANTIAVIGQATGGKPRTFLPIGTPSEASSQLRGGVLLDVLNNMYNPSNEVPGAGDVLYYRLNLAIQAALGLPDQVTTPGTVTPTPSASGGTLATGAYFVKVSALNGAGESLPSVETSSISVTGPTGSIALAWAAVPGATGYKVYVTNAGTGTENISFQTVTNAYTVTTLTGGVAGAPLSAATLSVINFTALDYGVWTNQIRVKIAAGSITGKKITINNVLDTVNFENGDNLGNAFSLQYTGSLYACRLSITKTGDVATTLLIQTQAASGSDPWVTMTTLDLTNASVATMGMLTQYLAGLQSVTVTILGDPNEPVGDLDAVTTQDIKTAVYTATANIGAIVYWVNSQSLLVSAARATGAVNVPSNVSYTFLLGGSEGAVPTNSDWQAALDALLSIECNLVFVCSESAAIHAMALAHCNAASDVKARKERLCVLGGARGESVAQVVARAQGLAGARSVLCYPGVNQIDLISGNIVNRSPMYTAALVCGMAGGIRPEIPLTFKTINGTVQGLERDLQLTDIETLLNFGVLPVEHVVSDGIFRIVQGLTTYLVDNNVIWRKVAGVRIADYLNSQIRNAVARYIGRVADQRTVTSILNAVVSTLTQLTRSATNQTGVLTAGNKPDGSPEPAFKNVQAIFDGFDLVAVSYMAHPVGEVAYITITAGLTPTQIVAK